jgi:hypothetical protein
VLTNKSDRDLKELSCCVLSKMLRIRVNEIILLVVCYGSDALSLTLSEKWKLLCLETTKRSELRRF